jgi:F-type H+-transporting ATPase subunit epsilon
MQIVDVGCRYNKYSQIAARALRQSLKEGERVKAEKRGLTAMRYQHWENGKGGEQVCLSFWISSRIKADWQQVHLNPPAQPSSPPKSAAV